MDKLEQMGIMSGRLATKCNNQKECDGCQLEKIGAMHDFCCYSNNINDYDKMIDHCKLMNVDISDIVDEPKEGKKINNEFTKSDIEPGYILQLNDGKFVIAMGEKRNLIFYNFDVTKSQLIGYAFCLDDIKDDLTVFATKAVVTIYGHSFSKTLGLGDRLILWERKETECKIYNIETSEQYIKIQPNANTYLSNDSDGDVYIENLTDIDEVITINRENLPGLIAALKEIQELYEQEKE